MKPRTNVIYILVDQLRYHSTPLAGDPIARMPNLMRLAAQGTTFDQTVATAPVCTAYRAALFTGKYTTSNGMVINELRINPNQPCLGHALTAAGYDTCYIGKWHLWANELGNHSDPKNSFVPRGKHRLGFDGEWYAYNFHHVSFGEQAYYHTESPEKIFYPGNRFEPDAQTDIAIDYLRRREKNETPFAMVLSYGTPHDPWSKDNVKPEDDALFNESQFPHPPNYKPSNDPHADGWARLSEEDRAQLSSWRRRYYAMTANLDQNLGRLMATLRELGLEDDTLVIWTSDHGEMFGAQGRRAKNIFYEEACRVPTVMRLPGVIPAGRRSELLVSTVDWFPTLGGLLGFDVPTSQLEGVDLSACMRDPSKRGPADQMLMICGATANWDQGHEWRALRTNRYTFARYRSDGEELLFDNVVDPYQTRNGIADAGHRDIAERLRNRLAERMAAIKDEFLPSAYCRDHWTDGDRKIIRSATQDWSALGTD